METITISPRAAASAIVASRPPQIIINGIRRQDLFVLELEISQGPAFGIATITATGRQGSIYRSGQLEAQLPAIGSAVEIMPPAGLGGITFRGVVTSHQLSLSGEPDVPAAIVENSLAISLRSAVASKRELSGGIPAIAEADTLAFNDSQQNLASTPRYSINGRSVRVFDSSDDALWWTAGDAINYLIASALPAGVFVQSAAEIESLCGTIRLEAARFVNKTAGEILADIAASAGLAMRASSDGQNVIFFRPGIDGKIMQARLQPVGEVFSPRLSKVRNASIKKVKKSAGRKVIVFGDYKRYQATFTLRPGWDKSLETDRWRDFVRSDSSDWRKVYDVFRKWVLNEHGRYSGPPWNLSTYDFSGISGDDFYLTVPRRFLPCISCDSSGQSLGAIVEWRPTSDDQWRRWPGAISTADAECAIRIEDDRLPGEFFQAAVEGTAEFRVTACVDSDMRLKVETPGNPARPARTIDFSTRAKWQRIHSSSVISGSSGAAGTTERDDIKLLQGVAAVSQQRESSAVQIELELGWIDMTYQIGDVVERIDGIDLDLIGKPNARPAITKLIHELDERWRTRIELGG